MRREPLARRGNSTPSSRSRDQHLPRRAEFVEAAKHCDDRLPHGFIRRDHHPVVLVIVHTDRKSLPQFAFGCLVFQPRGQAGLDQVQLGLRHGALEPEHEPVIEIGRVIDAVSVGDQGVGDRAQIQQLIPVGVVASVRRANPGRRGRRGLYPEDDHVER